jgi:hypothetical protein
MVRQCSLMPDGAKPQTEHRDVPTNQSRPFRIDGVRIRSASPPPAARSRGGTSGQAASDSCLPVGTRDGGAPEGCAARRASLPKRSGAPPPRHDAPHRRSGRTRLDEPYRVRPPTLGAATRSRPQTALSSVKYRKRGNRHCAPCSWDSGADANGRRLSTAPRATIRGSPVR